MNLYEAENLLVRGHLAALAGGHRATAKMLESGPGVGKSETVKAYVGRLARETNKPAALVTMMLSTITSPDVRGFMVPTDRGGRLVSVFSQPPWFPVAENMQVCLPDGTFIPLGRYDGAVPEVGVLFLDEFGQAEDDVRKPAAELLLCGTVGNTTLPQGWAVVGATNRMSDRSGVGRELMFLVNRRCLLKIEASLPAWLEWANKRSEATRPHYLCMSFAQRQPDIVFGSELPADGSPFCTPRSLCLMDRDLRALRTPEQIKLDVLPMDDLAREVCEGWIGRGAAAQFFTHLKYADALPTLEEIERDPMRAKCSDDRAVQMVAGYMLSHRLTEKNAKPILTYIQRLCTEMQVLALRSIAASPDGKRTAALMAQKDYTAWLTKHKDLLVASRS